MTNFRTIKGMIREINNNRPKVIQYKTHFLELDNDKYVERIEGEETENYIKLDTTTNKVKTFYIEGEYQEFQTKSKNNHLYLDTGEIIDYVIENKASLRQTAKFFNVTAVTIANRLKKADNPKIKEIMENNRSKKYGKKFEYNNDLISILDKYTKGDWRIEPLDGDEVDKLTEEIRTKLNEINGNT